MSLLARGSCGCSARGRGARVAGYRLLCCSVAVLLFCSALCCCVAVLLCCSALCCSAAVLQCCSAAVLQCCSAAVLQCCSAAVLQCCSAAMLQCCSAQVAVSGSTFTCDVRAARHLSILWSRRRNAMFWGGLTMPHAPFAPVLQTVAGSTVTHASFARCSKRSFALAALRSQCCPVFWAHPNLQDAFSSTRGQSSSSTRGQSSSSTRGQSSSSTHGQSNRSTHDHLDSTSKFLTHAMRAHRVITILANVREDKARSTGCDAVCTPY